jgi:hypothetical protein
MLNNATIFSTDKLWYITRVNGRVLEKALIYDMALVWITKQQYLLCGSHKDIGFLEYCIGSSWLQKTQIRADKVWADPPAVGYIPMLILAEWIGTLFFPVDKLQIFFLLGKGSGRRRPRRRTEKGAEACLARRGPMEIQHRGGVGNSKVVKVQSEEAWDLFTDQASKEGRPVGSPSFASFLWPCFFCSCWDFVQFSKF